MAHLSLEKFADRLSEIMPVMMREFTRHQPSRFYKMKLTLPQFVILDILNRLGESKMTDLAHALNVTTAAMTGSIGRLVRDGYVRRESDPADRRIIKVMVTARGVKLVKDVQEKRRKLVMEMFSKISQEEREEYIKILEHIKSHIK